MAANVEREEVEAILEGGADRVAETVGERDFRRPQRLSSDAMGEFERSLARALASFARTIGGHFEAIPTIDVPRVREDVADDLVNHLHDSPLIVEFGSHGQITWISFDAHFITRLVECLLGADGEAGTPRALSTTELKVLESFFRVEFAPILTQLGGTCDDLVVRQDPADLARWQNVPGVPDPHRLVAEVDLGLGTRSTSFSVWLPGVAPGSTTLDEDEVLLPEHLVQVDLALVAELAGCEVTLEALLALEVGDVIPIEAKVGDAVHLTLDGQSIARGALGQHNGSIATRILEFDGPPPLSPPSSAEDQAA